MTTPTVEQLKKLISKKEKLIVKHRNELVELITTIQNICPHEHKTVTERYFDGDYLNKAYTNYTSVCSDCGRNLGTTTEIHSYYG